MAFLHRSFQPRAKVYLTTHIDGDEKRFSSVPAPFVFATTAFGRHTGADDAGRPHHPAPRRRIQSTMGNEVAPEVRRNAPGRPKGNDRTGERMVNQNTGRGLLLAAVALLFLFQAPRYTMGSLSEPGPGLFPVIVAGILLVIGIAIVVRSHFSEAVPLDFHVRNIALIAASLVGFTLVSEYVNMFAGVAVMVTMASLASDDFSMPRTAAIIVVLCLVAIAMKKGLGVQLPLY
jgi:hypothetical protein